MSTQTLQPTLWVMDINPSGTAVFQKVLSIIRMDVQKDQLLTGTHVVHGWPRPSPGTNLLPLSRGRGKTKIYASTETTTSEWWLVYKDKELHLTQDFALEYTSQGVFLVTNTKDPECAEEVIKKLRAAGLESNKNKSFIAPKGAYFEFRESVE